MIYSGKPNGIKQIDRGPAGPVEVGGVIVDGVEWVVRVDGVLCLVPGRQKSQTG
jgi:hypothetical protein